MNTPMQYARGEHPELAPPPSSVGAVGWMRTNLFSSFWNTVLTVVTLAVVFFVVRSTLDWAFFDAVMDAANNRECNDKGDGACWAFLSGNRIQTFIFGNYTDSERWRPVLALVLLVVALLPVLWDNCPARAKMVLFSLIYPFFGAWLLIGGTASESVLLAVIVLVLGFALSSSIARAIAGEDDLVKAGRISAGVRLGLILVAIGIIWFDLPGLGLLLSVDTRDWGGVLLTVVIGVTGIVASLPLGIMLALGRQSTMPVLNTLSVIFIEFIRGVPLITLLFVASTMLNYFLPPGTEFDLLLRVLVMVTLFASAYMAEVIRGGLQAIPKGQFEGADSLGLNYSQSMQLIILPQALKISIPGIVNTFIGLFKDTTLVLIIGMLDLLGTGRAALADAKWIGMAPEVYAFVAVFFFICCFGMSRYSKYLEDKLHTGHNR
ncbi:amino acid ABC transporter permease [Gammaproteobacteria bacterium]|nr:amino acid ABC transporter permease [Gammaproteobacteria bacterium]